MSCLCDSLCNASKKMSNWNLALCRRSPVYLSYYIERYHFILWSIEDCIVSKYWLRCIGAVCFGRPHFVWDSIMKYLRESWCSNDWLVYWNHPSLLHIYECIVFISSFFRLILFSNVWEIYSSNRTRVQKLIQIHPLQHWVKYVNVFQNYALRNLWC